MPVRPDIYDHGVDFRDLARHDPQFAKKLKPNGHLDFLDPEGVRQLTKSLLRRDFDIEIELPEDRLCPPVRLSYSVSVPVRRFNYVLFIQSLLESSCGGFNEGHDPHREIVGLDIGTGSSAIYPLLALRQRPKWKFIATELDPQNHAFATHNIETNHLSQAIHLLPLHLTSADHLLPPLEEFERIDIQLTNPPFYSSRSSLQESAQAKSRPPNSSCTGAEIEMIYADGGEIGFVKKLVDESMTNRMREKVQWFSAMLGKLESLARIVNVLIEAGCTNYVVTEFVNVKAEGKGKTKSKTRRWCIAWSWWAYRPSNDVARGISARSAAEKGIALPYKTEDTIFVSTGGGLTGEKVVSMLDESLLSLTTDGIEWSWDPVNWKGQGQSKKGDIWSRKARRNRTRERQRDYRDDVMEINESEAGRKDPCFSFRIFVLEDQDMKVKVNIRWLQGHDPIIFESFCGWLRRKIKYS